MKLIPKFSKLHNLKAFTLLEVLVGLMITMSLFAATASMFFSTTIKSRDHQVIASTDELARSVLDMIAFDLRMAGAGMPLGQQFFDPTDSSLGDAPLPILLDATENSITLRLNEKGAQTVITSEYTPGTFNVVFDVLSSEGFAEGNIVYLSDMNSGGRNGLRGEITAVSGNTITIDPSFIASSGVVFPIGTPVHKVSEVTYTSSDPDVIGITRNNGGDDIELAPRSTFSLEYLTYGETAISLPLTESVVRDSLATIRVTVTIESLEPVAKSFYTAEVQQLVTLRNLLINR